LVLQVCTVISEHGLAETWGRNSFDFGGLASLFQVGLFLFHFWHFLIGLFKFTLKKKIRVFKAGYFVSMPLNKLAWDNSYSKLRLGLEKNGLVQQV